MDTIEQKSTPQQFFTFLVAHIRSLGMIQAILFSFNTILITIIFGSGLHTMMSEVVGNFPISKVFYLPLGFVLMVILVLATHYITDLSTELVYHWQRFATPYKIMLPLTNIALLLFCYAIQSEGGEILVQQDYDHAIIAIEADTMSNNLTKLDERIALADWELQKSDSIIEAYNALRASRKTHWLNPSENQILLTAQTSKQQLNKQLATFMNQRIAESAVISERNEAKIKKLQEKKASAVTRSRGKAGFAECLLDFTAFFSRAHKNRYKTYKADADATASTVIMEFPKNLSIDEREEMLKAFTPLYFHKEEHSLVVEYQQEQYFLAIPKVIKSIGTCRARFRSAKSEDSQDTQLRNIAYYEQLLAMTGLEIIDLKRVYGYDAFNVDYWKNTTRNVAQQVGETLEKPFPNVVQRSATVV